ncbi:MAG: LPS assembly protein LptD, partial [Candidatus Thermoplasmatota archaeon]|nr:LPS assembly protein LptD [Candidatus Thermoplasmatota archaeon]
LKRQTGLLSPQYAYSSRNGIEYIQPFFWAINKSSDATFYEHYIQRRGDKVGLEYRYLLSENSKGTLMYDYLNDSKIDDGTGSSSEDWGYGDDNILRPNSDRYWFRMKLNQEMPLDFSAKLDLDIVSDQDYLHEFRDGYTGFLKTDEYFHKNFGRDLDDNGDSTRVNKLNLNKIWSNYSLNIETRWYDNVIIRRKEELDTTLQKLPFIEFDGTKQRFLGTPFYFDLDTEYTHFYRKDGTPSENITSYNRTDVHPRFYLPLRFKNYFTFEPSYGIRTTTWNIDEYESTPTESDRIQNRVIYDTRLDLSTEIFKTFDINGKSIDRIKHAVRPQIVHEFIPEKIQDQYPYFDSMDRIDKKNLVTYSLTNTFTSKLKEYIKKTDDHNEDNNELYGFKYNQFMRLKLEQSCDINIANETDSYKWANKETKQPFSPVKGTLELVPLKYFSIYADAEWSQHENEILSHNTLANLFDQRGDNLLVEHRYQRDSSGSVQDGKQSIYTYCLLKISDSLSTYGEFERNIYDKENMKKGLGFLYESQCWSIEVIYTDEAEEQKYLFMVNLYGLGGLQTGVATRE